MIKRNYHFPSFQVFAQLARRGYWTQGVWLPVCPEAHSFKLKFTEKKPVQESLDKCQNASIKLHHRLAQLSQIKVDFVIIFVRVQFGLCLILVQVGLCFLIVRVLFMEEGEGSFHVIPCRGLGGLCYHYPQLFLIPVLFVVSNVP